MFQQDGAPAHTADRAQGYLTRQEMPFWPKDFWPPSPDLNPLDFSIWAHMKQEVQGVSHLNTEARKAKIAEKCEAMDEDYIRRVCGSFCRSVQGVIAADGTYYE